MQISCKLRETRISRTHNRKEARTHLAVNTVNTKVPIAGPLTALGKRSATTPAATGPSIQANVPWTKREAMIEATFGARAWGRKRIMMLQRQRASYCVR